MKQIRTEDHVDEAIFPTPVLFHVATSTADLVVHGIQMVEDRIDLKNRPDVPRQRMGEDYREG